MDKPKIENKRFFPKVHDVELIYVGEGRKVGNIPQRDLNPREVILYGGAFYLVKTGLYCYPEQIKND